MGVCNCSMFCCTLLYVLSSIAIILMGKRELIALLNLSSWCLVMVERLFLAVPRGCLQFVIVVFPDHAHLLFFIFTHSKFMLLETVNNLCQRNAYSAGPNEMSPMWHPVRVCIVYRIIPEYRIMRLTFQKKSASKS